MPRSRGNRNFGAVSMNEMNCTVASSFAIVTSVSGLEMKLKFVELLNVKANVSSGSIVVSPVIGTLTVKDVLPAGIVTVPDAAT